MAYDLVVDLGTDSDVALPLRPPQSLPFLLLSDTPMVTVCRSMLRFLTTTSGEMETPNRLVNR